MKRNNPSPFGYFLGKRKKYNKAFTLVELIVVITILAILGTIAFLSFQGYSRDARDSVRISDLSNIGKQLELMLVKAGQVYIPENKVDITASGTVILYQGEIGLDTLNKLRVNNGGLDPVDQTPYTYSTTKNLKRYQLMGFLEGGGVASVVSQANASANLSNRFPITKGDSIGIILDPTTNSPIQSTGTGVDIVNINTNYKVYLDKNNIFSGTGSNISRIDTLVKYGKHNTCKDYLDNNQGLLGKDGLYLILNNLGKFENVYCDMTTNGGGWTAFYSTIKSNIQYLSGNIIPGNSTYGKINSDLWSSNLTGFKFNKFLIQTYLLGVKHNNIYKTISPALFNLNNDKRYEVSGISNCNQNLAGFLIRYRQKYGVSNWEVGINLILNGAMDSICANGVGVTTSGGNILWVNGAIYPYIQGDKVIFYIK